MIFPLDTATLEVLYENGEISAAAFAAIAPIQWLTEHHPDVVNSEEKALQVLNACQPKAKTCNSCIHFSSLHKCCMTRIDEKSTYLPVNETTPACMDFEGVSLPSFLKTGGNI